MKNTQVLLKCVLFLTLIVSSEISSIQGRQLRPILNSHHDLKEANNRREIVGISSEQGMNNHTNSNSSVGDHKLGMKDSKEEQHNKDAFRPTAPGNSPGGGHAFELISSPNGKRRGHFVTTTTTEAPTNDFRPTTPGNSPGAGHSFEQTSSPDRHYVPLDDKDGYRPTTPGNSPGAGHAFEQITSPNAYERKFATTESGGVFGHDNLGNNN